MRVCLGGTFEPLHAGHQALLAAAADGATELFVGFTTSGLQLRPDRSISYWPIRARAVEALLRGEIGYKGILRMAPLLDAEGPAAEQPFDRIIVSPETVPGAQAINKRRRRNRLAPMEIKVVPHVLAQDLLPVSGTAVHAGLIDRNGKRLKPVRVAVGSANPVKVEAVRLEMERLFPNVACTVTGHHVKSGVPEQPEGRQTLDGAANRAANAAHQSLPHGGFDYAIGIEAGLIRYPGEMELHEAQACVVIDRLGQRSTGWGPGFSYPGWVTRRALKGEMVSKILGPVAGDASMGSTTGAVGFLSDGRTDRTQLTRQAILMAFMPRLRRELYVVDRE